VGREQRGEEIPGVEVVLGWAEDKEVKIPGGEVVLGWTEDKEVNRYQVWR